MTVLLTGASGFVGGAVLKSAMQKGIVVRPVLRTLRQAEYFCSTQNTAVLVPSIDENTDWSLALPGISVVIHCAARVHVMNDKTSDRLTEFSKVNVAGTLNLARQAAESGVRRFLYISSIKVNGENTGSYGKSYTADADPAPEDDYGLSKSIAEAGLRQLAKETGMGVTIIRPPLVYGPGAKGNFPQLVSWIVRGLPLPLGAVTNNRRSLVALGNLVDLILVCVDHPKAENQTFLVSDGEDLSTAELLNKMCNILQRPVWLLPVPVRVLSFVASLLGKKEVAQRLLGSLQVDISKTCTLLSWRPPLSVDEGLRRALK